MSFKADIDEFSFESPEWVGSRRWATTDGFHRLNGGKRPGAAIRDIDKTLAAVVPVQNKCT
jgi:hypothetical protein